MSIRPEPFTYERPVGADVVMDQPVILTPEGTCTLHVKAWAYRGKTVDFALTQMADEVEDPQSGEDHVARYDCCHSEVHKHQYYRSGRHYKTGETEARTTICPIDKKETSWATVDESYFDCYDQMVDSWQVNYERWASDGQRDS